jgi:autotransporter-associated beta strand protein
MKLTTPLLHTARLAIESVSFRRISAFFLLGVLCVGFGIGHATAAQLIWDPNLNGGATSAGGNWDTTGGNTVWWNGTSDVLWSQTSTTVPLNGATFGGGDGNYAIVMDAVQISVNSLIVNNSGYTFSGANAIFLANNDILSVAAGKTVNFNCGLQGGATAPSWLLGSGSVMNVAGNITSSQQLRLTGPAGSTYNVSGAANTPAQMYILAPVNVTGGSTTVSSLLSIGYPVATANNGFNTGVLTVSGSAVLTANGNFLMVSRSGGNGTLTLNNGTVNVGNTAAAPKNLAICYENAPGGIGTVNMNGGTLNVGSATIAAGIEFFQVSVAGAGAAPVATMNQTAGVVNTWNGITFGTLAAGSFPNGGSATLTQSGGTLNIGGGINGIKLGATAPPSMSITLSGGTVGALANWSSSLPITLGTANGNITFQCADASGTDHNIGLSGALTGAGGLYVTAGGASSGTLTLSGANNYTGSTVVSNGTLAIVTGSSPMINGPVTLDGTTGSPTVAVTVSNPGQYWTNSGTFTFIHATSGVPTLSFQFGALAPSTTVAPIQVTGGVAFTATPNVNVGGSAIAVGTYPLIKYAGAISGTMPTVANITLSGGSASGYVTNITASKTIALVVTSSTYNPALYWRVGSGVWDINTTANWTQFGGPVKYTDGSAVVFDDSATGPSPITVTLNTVVNPLAVTANNTTNNATGKSYIIAGTGGITGSGVLELLGTGTLTLSGTNSYTGGTTLSAGQLNINNGGDPTYGTAIGFGPLTINAGATIDNTSGSDVTLQFPISENWNGNFTYLGSAHNFNTGAGGVSMGGSLSIAVNSNTFTVGGTINDSGLNYALTKTGNGTLTLPFVNFFGGGLTLFSGQLNLGDPSAAGSGVFTIDGGAIDNSSGAEFTLAPASSVWAGNFSFLGSTNLGLSGTVVIPNGLGNVTVNVVSNNLSTFGDIVNNNTRVTKSGNGTWEIAGSATGAESLGLLVSAGQVNLHKSGGQAIQGGNNVGLTVQTGALVLDENNFQIHSGSVVPLPVVLSGGVWDLNGHNENVDQLSISSSGTLRNSAPASTSSLTTISGYTAQLSGANCQFDVTAVDGILNFNGALGGSGSLVKIGLGVLNLNSNNTYTGDTTVSGGALSLVFPCLANASTVTVATNATLQLNFAETNLVAGLVLNGVSRPAGIYDATTDPTYLAGTGSLQVGSSIPTGPTNITFSVSGNTLSLSWPSNYVGWILQTNVINVGVSNDWFNVPGSETNTQLAFPMTDPAISNEFFRLRHP